MVRTLRATGDHLGEREDAVRAMGLNDNPKRDFIELLNGSSLERWI